MTEPFGDDADRYPGLEGDVGVGVSEIVEPEPWDVEAAREGREGFAELIVWQTSFSWTQESPPTRFSAQPRLPIPRDGSFTTQV